jgi:hypothetical protein
MSSGQDIAFITLVSSIGLCFLVIGYTSLTSKSTDSQTTNIAGPGLYAAVKRPIEFQPLTHDDNSVGTGGCNNCKTNKTTKKTIKHGKNKNKTKTKIKTK